MKEQNQAFKEETVSTQHIFKGNIISLDVETVKLPNGKQATREIVRHLGAVAVLAIRGDKMLAVEQYRKPLNRSLVEIPAGKLDYLGEDPLEAAKRELREETGYASGTMIKLHEFYTAPGFCDELIHLYVATELTAGETDPDEDEFLNIEELSLDEAMDAIRTGRIRDAKTIMAVLAWSRYKLSGTWQ